MIISTETDPAAASSLVEETLVRLRVWATHDLKNLEGPQQYLLGTDPDCWWRLVDPKHLLSRKHAQLAFDGMRWVLTNLSKNKIHVGTVAYEKLVVAPGLAVTLGGVTIVAESAREIDLRVFLLRILGYTRLNAVDVALQSLRAAIYDRKSLTLCGHGDLVPIARALHRRMFKQRPFVVSKRGRQDTGETVRVAQNFQQGMAALAAAAGGSVCVVDGKLPVDFNDVLVALAEPTTRVQLIVCQENPKKAGQAAEAVVIPSLADRGTEAELIVQEYGAEAMTAMELDGAMKTDDKAWVRKNCADSLADIEKGTMRIAALRRYRSKHGAANALGMSHVALSKWLQLRTTLPFRIGS
ncbi:MAG: FHA domain-containing protein [Deltaproteobacteria bacterium]|nr:FHA domain-containing protein [Deltaproteobacteria bacterium]